MTSIRYDSRRQSIRIGTPLYKLILASLFAVPLGIAGSLFALAVHTGEIDAGDSRRAAAFALMAPFIGTMGPVIALHVAVNLIARRPAVRARPGEFLAQTFMGDVVIPAEEVAAVGLEREGAELRLRFVHHAEEDRGGSVNADRAPPGDLWRFPAPYLKPDSPKTAEAVDALSAFLEERRMNREEASAL